MSAPIKVRTSKSYVRDIEALGRLRSAIMIDPSLRAASAAEALTRIDELIRALVALIPRE